MGRPFIKVQTPPTRTHTQEDTWKEVQFHYEWEKLKLKQEHIVFNTSTEKSDKTRKLIAGKAMKENGSVPWDSFCGNHLVTTQVICKAFYLTIQALGMYLILIQRCMCKSVIAALLVIVEFAHTHTHPESNVICQMDSLYCKHVSAWDKMPQACTGLKNVQLAEKTKAGHIPGPWLGQPSAPRDHTAPPPAASPSSFFHASPSPHDSP